MVFEIRGEQIELRFPEATVLGDPLERGAHGRGAERRPAHSSLFLDGGQSGALQHAHVFGDRGERHVESRCELTNGAIARGEPGEDVAPGGVGERGEGVIERPRKVNHMV